MFVRTVAVKTGNLDMRTKTDHLFTNLFYKTNNNAHSC